MCLGTSKKKRSLSAFLSRANFCRWQRGRSSCGSVQHSALLHQLCSRAGWDYQEQVAHLHWSFEVGCLPAQPEGVFSRCFYVYWLQLTQWFVCLVASLKKKTNTTEGLIHNLRRVFPVLRGRVSVVGYSSRDGFFSCASIACFRQSESLKKLSNTAIWKYFYYFNLFDMDPHKVALGRIFCPSVWLQWWSCSLGVVAYLEALALWMLPIEYVIVVVISQSTL